MDAEFTKMSHKEDQPVRARYLRNILGSVAIVLGVGSVYMIGVKSTPSVDIHSVAGLEADAPRFGWVEARGESFGPAANLVVVKLKEAGVKRGQIISIDAHTTEEGGIFQVGENGECIFSAHYSKSYPSEGDLDIAWTQWTTKGFDWSWKTNYDLSSPAQKDTTDLISITSSGSKGGLGVTFVFSYSPPACAARFAFTHGIKTLEARGGAWDGTVKDIIAQIKASGAQRGQVVGIDAHGDTSHAIVSAVLDFGAPGFGEFDIGYHAQNSASGDWPALYNKASAEADVDVISFTSSFNTYFKSVSYVFYYMPATSMKSTKSNCWEDLHPHDAKQTQKKNKGKCAANDVHMCIPCKAGQHPDHNECRTNKCQCENGLGATAAACSSNGAQQCSSCDQGYWLHGKECRTNKCQCENGLGATAAACSSNGAQQCSSCDQGYWLHGKACKINSCHCMDGKGFKGKGCPSHHATKCEKCVEDYHIVGITCVEDDVLAMAAVNCHCLNGRGARGANCPRHNASICESCAEGHHLLGFTCVEDVEELSLVEEVTAPLDEKA